MVLKILKFSSQQTRVKNLINFQIYQTYQNMTSNKKSYHVGPFWLPLTPPLSFFFIHTILLKSVAVQLLVKKMNIFITETIRARSNPFEKHQREYS